MTEESAPERGDVLWTDLEPHRGHEQGGYRPMVVLSPRSYNSRVGLALCVPVTTRKKGYPFEVALPEGLPVEGVVLSDQMRLLDLNDRAARSLGRLPPDVIAHILARARTLLD